MTKVDRKLIAQGKAEATEDRTAAAAEAAQRRAKKKNMWAKTKYYIAVGVGIFFVVFAIFLAATGSSGKKEKGGVSPLASTVNDRYFVSDTTSNSAGNFTAAGSPFFNRWTYGDVKFGLDGVALHGAGMVGMPGAVQYCKDDKDIEGGTLPPAYDVRTAWPDCVGEVHDTGNCSSSYSVAAAASLSSRFCIEDNAKYGGLRLSAQQAISCDKKSKGCEGGGVDSVWAYIKRRGLYPEECVPFAGGKKAECKTVGKNCGEEKKLKALEYCVLSSSDSKKLKREIYNRGPVVAPMYLRDDLLVYSNGVYTPVESSKQQYGPNGEALLVAVTIIGWGKHEGVGYWTVQNSWGKEWGEGGYARIAIDVDEPALRDGYILVGTPATDEAIAEKEKQKAEAAVRLEEAKKERAERNARIAEREAARAEEMRAAQSAEEDAALDELDLDLDEFEEGMDEEAGEEKKEDETHDEM